VVPARHEEEIPDVRKNSTRQPKVADTQFNEARAKIPVGRIVNPSAACGTD
jgi:hypothetical protein